MTAGECSFLARWPTRLVILLLLLCGLYGSYRAVHLAIVNDEVGLLDSARQDGYAKLLLASDKDSNLHFLATLLAKPCVEFLPLNEIVASRLPSLLGLALFLWGVWRIGLVFPTGTTRVLVTLALLSNAFLLDYFSLARGYGLAVGFTVLSLSFLVRASGLKLTGDESVRRQAGASLWFAAGAALSNMGFLYFYAALLGVVIWLTRRDRLWVAWGGSSLVLGVFYMHRVVQARSENWLYLGGDNGFVHDTVGSLVRASLYDWSVAAGLVQLLSGALALLVLLLAYWSYRERIRVASTLSVLGILVSALCVAGTKLWGVKYPVERAALYLVPLVILIIGVVAAWSRLRWARLALWGVLLALTGVGLQGVNLSHTFTWRECADIPSALLALQKVHQQTGQDVTVAISGSKWTIWYYAEHLLGLRPKPSRKDLAHLRTHDWLTTYEWSILRPDYGLPADNPLIPGTTHVLLSLRDPDDRRLLSMPPPGGLTQLAFYPASDTTLEALAIPQHQGVTILPDGRKYVGEFRRGLANGRGTATLPNGEKYVGEFKDGSLEGQGAYTWPDGRIYVGGFRNGMLAGQGVATWPDGRKYVGEFRGGGADGTGKLIYPDGRVEDGLWKQGQFVGAAVP